MQPQSIPDNYQSIPSKIEGILVYGPRPEASPSEEPVTYKCPNCGATTQYDVAAGGVACEYCGYTAAVRSEKVGKSAQQFEFTLDTWNQAAKGWGIERRELYCENCGASLSIDDQALTVTCPFCASNKVNVRAAISDVLRPRFLIPFKVETESNRERVKGWLGKGWFHPSELSKSAGIDRFIGIYLPYWTFSAQVKASWKAEVGYERQENYYDAGEKEWKTRTVIDWRWENGEVPVSFNDLLIPGSSKVSHLILKRINPFNLNELVQYSPDFLAGWQANAYDITLPNAWEEGKTFMREHSKEACYEDIHSAHIRNFSMTADFGDETWRYILLPIYLSTYKFENKVYQVMVNGQTGDIAGQKPVAWWKVWLAIAALLVPGLLFGLIGLPLLLVGGVGLIPLLIGFILFIIGFGISIVLYRQAAASEAT